MDGITMVCVFDIQERGTPETIGIIGFKCVKTFREYGFASCGRGSRLQGHRERAAPDRKSFATRFQILARSETERRRFFDLTSHARGILLQAQTGPGQGIPLAGGGSNIESAPIQAHL